MRKVAFIIQHLTNGGAERTISNLSMILSDKCELYIIIFDGSNITYPYEGTLIDLKLPPLEGKFNKFLNTIKRIKAVKRIKKQYNFDCVISFMFGANIVNALSGKKGKIVTSARNYMSSYGTGFFKKLKEKITGNKSDIVVALSKTVEDDLNDTFGISKKKTTTIYNPCDIERIRRLSNQDCNYKFEDGTFYFVTAGRMVEQKGQWHLLKAFSKVKKQIKNAKLIFLGSGELENKLRSLTHEMKLDEDVVFTGFIDNPYSYIARSNCFVLPSLFEGLGNVILEAMACSVPVVSFDCLAGPRELIAPESDRHKRAEQVEKCSCGILTPFTDKSVDWSLNINSDEDQLASAMCEIVYNPEVAKEMVSNANERLKEFTNENIANKWMDIINNQGDCNGK